MCVGSLIACLHKLCMFYSLAPKFQKTPHESIVKCMQINGDDILLKGINGFHDFNVDVMNNPKFNLAK